MLYQYLLLIFSTHLDLPETDVQSGQITENQTSVLPVRWKNVIAGIVGILFGLFLIWFVLWITREPDENRLPGEGRFLVFEPELCYEARFAPETAIGAET